MKHLKSDPYGAQAGSSYENAAASTVRYKADKTATSPVIYKPSKSIGKPAAPVYENYQKK